MTQSEFGGEGARTLELSSFGCLLGAALTENGAELAFNGVGQGIVVYGPYVELGPGLYVFSVAVTFPARGTPRFSVEIFGEGQVYARQRVSTRCGMLRIPIVLDGTSRIEVRCQSEWTAFSLTGVEVERVSHFASVDQDSHQRLVDGALRFILRDGPPVSLESWKDSANVSRMIFGGNAITAISLENLYEHEEALRRVGVNPAAIHAVFSQGQHERPVGELPGVELTDGYPKARNSFQDKILRDGTYEVLCPFTGEPRSTHGSIPVLIGASLISIVYEFLGRREFVIGASCGWAGALGFVWLVEERIVISSEIAYSNWTNVEDIIAQYVASCASNLDDVRRYRTRPLQLALASGFISNMGHYFWNEVSGVERMIRAGCLDRVGRVYTPVHPWLSIDQIFAEELPDVEQLSDWSRIVGSVLERGELLVRPTGTAWDDGLGAKARIAAERVFRVKERARYEEVLSVTEPGGLVLFVNLRAHNKAWIEQSTGIGDIVGAIQAYLSTATRDGSSGPAGEPRTAPDRRLVVYLDGYRDCEDSAREIRAAAPPGVAFVDGTRAGFAETLWWAFRCDCFIAVIGSGLVPLTWLANKPGVCYSDRRHLDQLAWWSAVRQESAPLLAPRPDQVHDAIDVFYANYSIDPAVILDLVRDIVQPLLPTS